MPKSEKPAEQRENPVRRLPAVHAVLDSADAVALIEAHGRGRVVDAVRRKIEELRGSLRDGNALAPASCDAAAILAGAAEHLVRDARPRLMRVINATGIILHTGLGRAHMPDAARDALAGLTSYCNVQMDLETGARLKREHCVRDLVRDLTGAEEVLVVNNNAGATLLVLKALAEGREVVVSRGELIEIGGSFRLPDIMRQSGAILREVGATNKTHLRDYEQAACAETALLLKAHKSNYRIVGFSKDVSIAVVAQVGREHGIPVVDDMGCGALVDLEQYGLEHEMTMRESLEAGADIVLSSTDKLIGGPQGGLIVGRKDLLDRVRACPLYRALRVGKMTLAALEATLRLFQAPERLPQTHPIYTMMARTVSDMKAQAETLAADITGARPDWTVDVAEDISFLGGGSLPGLELPAWSVRIQSADQSADDISSVFRRAVPPVIPRIDDDAVCLNMRTLLRDDLTYIRQAV